ncbi:alpha-1,2-fucosyltransferase [Clostridium sp. AF19-22AC]|jgi:hypothetical protein|uniref:Glycosyl transferase family 11 n=1 Tax=Faecalicatena orotica TaxID=1544 RepID=A0A2Y9BP11_9FIRM|nr:MULTISPECIES: alpha-1,2-fucosyltransferase [Clostridia]PWJ20728.1 glycosyl transferase family 11 [Faecalicatena orotica]RHR28725.1 alpha-1,2-fucosyltransferase [Clostridium sp. AF19-22AC]SSA58527.1 Glycosyl transferase family 11 [Faecalicatena orotica]
MINLIIKDGLGNQMFQYAYTRYLKYQYEQQGKEEEIVINPYYINKYDYRKVSLQNFKLNDSVTFMNLAKQNANMNAFMARTIIANGTDLISWKILKKSKPLGEEKFLKRSRRGLYYTYRSQTEFKTVLSKAKNKYVFGCFQGESNFAPISDIIRQEFEFKTEPNEQNKIMLRQIESTEAICLHIRRGDYLNPEWRNLQICTFEYYNRAINEIMKRTNNPVFYIFTNTHQDIEWIKENYHFTNSVNNKQLRLVYVDLGNPDYEELRLMKSCRHFIISNSTFSWWAAYLSTALNKVVLVPERWNLSFENDNSIYLKDWIKIPTR